MNKFKNLFSSPIFLAFLATISTTFLVLLILNIFEKKQEANFYQYRIHPIGPLEDDAKEWANDFPHHYDDFIKTVDQVRTRYGGSEAMPRTPTQSDPRSVVAQSKLEEDPRLITMWSGYAFSKDFREERGHAYMLIDQKFTERQKVGQPGTCLQCHASVYRAMMTLGQGDLDRGFHALNKMKYDVAVKEVTHPVSCIDCHQPMTMKLHVTRPAFIEGIKKVKLAQGIKDYDVNKMATRQEMRSFVCGQCHVEYYFKGEDKTLTFPWDNGLKADEILEYYEKMGFKDWVHSKTKANSLKAQHPEFEMWNQGVHAKSGVSCVDCHMPYKRIGSNKISDHHVRSPLLNINRACQTCHNITEQEILERVENIQGKHMEMRNLAMNALIDLIKAIEFSKQGESQLNKARGFQRKAQFLIDFVEAENSTGFHAPQESARILMQSIDYSRKGMMELK